MGNGDSVWTPFLRSYSTDLGFVPSVHLAVNFEEPFFFYLF